MMRWLRCGFQLNGMDVPPPPTGQLTLPNWTWGDQPALSAFSCLLHTQRKANGLAALPLLLLMTVEWPGYKLEWISTLLTNDFLKNVFRSLESFSKHSAWQGPQADGSYRLNTQARIKWTGRTRRLVALRNVIHAEKPCQSRAREPRGKKAK